MTYRVHVTGPLAEYVEIPDCSREPKVGQPCRVTIQGVVINLGTITAVEVVDEV